MALALGLILAGCAKTPAASPPVGPSQAGTSEAVVVERAGRGTAIVSAARGDAGRWARLANTASAMIATRVAGVAPAWSGELVVEVPGSQRRFEQMVGAKPGSYGQIAAVTVAGGSDPGSPAERIVVNPVAADKLSDLGLAVLLAHEATHVATNSLDSSAPMWAVEGFADYVAYQAYPQARGVASGPLLGEIRTNGPPAGLPGEEDFTASASGLGVTYAEAWLACRYVAETSSPQQLDTIYTELDEGKSLSEAGRAAGFADSADAFETGWRKYLTRLAGR